MSVALTVSKLLTVNAQKCSGKLLAFNTQILTVRAHATLATPLFQNLSEVMSGLTLRHVCRILSL